MKLKKIVNLILAATMVMTMGVISFAAEPTRYTDTGERILGETVTELNDGLEMVETVALNEKTRGLNQASVAVIHTFKASGKYVAQVRLDATFQYGNGSVSCVYKTFQQMYNYSNATYILDAPVVTSGKVSGHYVRRLGAVVNGYNMSVQCSKDGKTVKSGDKTYNLM